MAKKHKHEEHVNHERWLVSYADFITLLFAFFVILYALSEVDKNKLKKFANSVQFAFSHVGTGGTQTMGKPTPLQKRPNIIGDAFPKGQRQSDPGPYEGLTGVVQYLDSSIVKHFVKRERSKAELIDDGRAVIVRLPVERLFAPSGATVRADRLRFLEDLGWCIEQFKLHLAVHVEVDLPFGGAELEQHGLATRRTDALMQAIWRASLTARASLTSRVVLAELDEVRNSEAEEGRSVVEFRVTRPGS
jgi:chemotaxis protein MotB